MESLRNRSSLGALFKNDRQNFHHRKISVGCDKLCQKTRELFAEGVGHLRSNHYERNVRFKEANLHNKVHQGFQRGLQVPQTLCNLPPEPSSEVP